MWLSIIIRYDAHLQHLSRRQSVHLHDERHLLWLAFTWEDGEAGEEFGEDAAKAPDIDGGSVGDGEHDLRGSIEATLDVRVDALICKAAAAEVDQLHPAAVLLLQQDVLWLQVAMNYRMFPQKAQGLEDLDGELPDEGEREAAEVVVLDEIVQVETQELEDDALDDQSGGLRYACGT